MISSTYIYQHTNMLLYLHVCTSVCECGCVDVYCVFVHVCVNVCVCVCVCMYPITTACEKREIIMSCDCHPFPYLFCSSVLQTES